MKGHMTKLQVRFCFGLLILLFQCLQAGRSRPSRSPKSDPPREPVPKSVTGTHTAVYDLPSCGGAPQQKFSVLQSNGSSQTFVCKSTRESNGLVEYGQGWQSKLYCELFEHCRLIMNFFNISERDSKEYGLLLGRAKGWEDHVRTYILVEHTEDELTELSLPQSLPETTPTYENGSTTSKDLENSSKGKVKYPAMNDNGTVLIVIPEGLLYSVVGLQVSVAIAVTVLIALNCRHNKTESSINIKCNKKMEDFMAEIRSIVGSKSEVREKQKEEEKVQMVEKLKLTETQTNPEDSSTSVLIASNTAEAVILNGLATNSKMNQPISYVPESLDGPEVILPSRNKSGDLQPPLQGNGMPVEVAQNSELVSPGKSYEDHGPARKKFDTAYYGGGSPGERGRLVQLGAAEEIKKDEKDQA